MKDWFGRLRRWFSAEPPSAPRTSPAWDPQLENIFNQIDPAVIRGGFDDRFTPADERQGRALFNRGWVQKRVSKSVRNETREKFYDWMNQHDMHSWDFPWDEWREWYDEQ